MIRELLVLTTLLTAVSAQGVERRSIEHLRVHELLESSRQVAVEPAPIRSDRYHVLALINPHSNMGARVLAKLARSGFDGEGITVVVLGDRETPPVDHEAVDQLLLPQARWVWVPSRMALPFLDLSGSPLLLGVDKDGVVHWQRAGAPERIETWLAAIEDWVKRVPPQHLPDTELDDEEQR